MEFLRRPAALGELEPRRCPFGIRQWLREPSRGLRDLRRYWKAAIPAMGEQEDLLQQVTRRQAELELWAKSGLEAEQPRWIVPEGWKLSLPSIVPATRPD